jgi:bacterioferritin-associated ferredoxin
MQPDEEICLCFHVTRRKIANYIRMHNVHRASQLAECLGAGTGCGWCRPFLRRLLESERGNPVDPLPQPHEYAKGRTKYVQAGKGTPPPGATPIDAE